MKKYFYTNKKGKLRMFSDKKIKVDKDIFDEHNLTTSKKELEDIENSKITYYKGGKLVKKPILII